MEHRLHSEWVSIITVRNYCGAVVSVFTWYFNYTESFAFLIILHFYLKKHADQHTTDHNIYIYLCHIIHSVFTDLVSD